MNDSMVTESFAFANTKEEVFTAVIQTMTKLGRTGPRVDRLLGKVSGPIKKGRTPFRLCSAEFTITEKAGITTVFLAIVCEHDSETSKSFSIEAMRQIIPWLVGVKQGLSPII
jgi:hypothetical protein